MNTTTTTPVNTEANTTTPVITRTWRPECSSASYAAMDATCTTAVKWWATVPVKSRRYLMWDLHCDLAKVADLAEFESLDEYLHHSDASLREHLRIDLILEPIISVPNKEPRMKKAEIHVGGMYMARIGGKEQPALVTSITPREGTHNMTYQLTNMVTGRKVTYRSHAKFRYEILEVPVGAKVLPAPTVVEPVVPVVEVKSETVTNPPSVEVLMDALLLEGVSPVGLPVAEVIEVIAPATPEFAGIVRETAAHRAERLSKRGIVESVPSATMAGCAAGISVAALMAQVTPPVHVETPAKASSSPSKVSGTVPAGLVNGGLGKQSSAIDEASAAWYYQSGLSIAKLSGKCRMHNLLHSPFAAKATLCRLLAAAGVKFQS